MSFSKITFRLQTKFSRNQVVQRRLLIFFLFLHLLPCSSSTIYDTCGGASSICLHRLQSVEVDLSSSSTVYGTCSRAFLIYLSFFFPDLSSSSSTFYGTCSGDFLVCLSIALEQLRVCQLLYQIFHSDDMGSSTIASLTFADCFCFFFLMFSSNDFFPLIFNLN